MFKQNRNLRQDLFKSAKEKRERERDAYLPFGLINHELRTARRTSASSRLTTSFHKGNTRNLGRKYDKYLDFRQQDTREFLRLWHAFFPIRPIAHQESKGTSTPSETETQVRNVSPHVAPVSLQLFPIQSSFWF